MRIKEQETRLNLHEHRDDDDDDVVDELFNYTATVTILNENFIAVHKISSTKTKAMYTVQNLMMADIEAETCSC